jgi:hypothetical protein
MTQEEALEYSKGYKEKWKPENGEVSIGYLFDEGSLCIMTYASDSKIGERSKDFCTPMFTTNCRRFRATTTEEFETMLPYMLKPF